MEYCGGGVGWCVYIVGLHAPCIQEQPMTEWSINVLVFSFSEALDCRNASTQVYPSNYPV